MSDAYLSGSRMRNQHSDDGRRRRKQSAESPGVRASGLGEISPSPYQRKDTQHVHINTPVNFPVMELSDINASTLVKLDAPETITEEVDCDNHVPVKKTSNLENDIDYESVPSIRRALYKTNTSFSSSICMYRSPEGLRIHNVCAYMPKLIFLGTQHDLKFESPSEIILKTSYCKKFIDRTGKNLDFIINHLDSCKAKVYDCYGNNDWPYLNVALFHACFIVEHLIRSYNPALREPSDNLPLMERRRNQIKRDLILLDNQIPYFLLESLYNLVDRSTISPIGEVSPTFDRLVLRFFEEYNNRGVHVNMKYVKHFTDLIRILHEPKRSQLGTRSDEDFDLTASATQLYDAGVAFKPMRGSCLLDIKFENGYLEIPCFELNDDHESLYRNLIAFELCHYPKDTFIIDYFVFMDTLINTYEDVNLLICAGVLVNRIGDHSDAADTFNRFCAGITHYKAKNSYLVPVLSELNKFYKAPTNTWMTTFKRDYFGSPFRSASTVTAVLLVLLTFVSTVCTIISVT